MNYWDILLAEKLKKDPPLPPIPDNAYLLEQATGDVITLTDAVNLPMPSATSTLTPIQDLHGYSNPWVGGAGKNLLPMTVEGIKSANTSGTWSGNVYILNNATFELLTDNANNITGISVKTIGTVSTNAIFVINSNTINGSYILSGCPSGGSTNSYVLNVSGIGSDTGNGFSFSDTGTATRNVSIYVFANASISNTITFYPMIRLATVTDPTFAPYSNICPISGYDSASYNRCGVNLFDEILESGSISISTGENIVNNNLCRSKNYIPILPNTNYYNYSTLASNLAIVSVFYDKNKNFITNVNGNNNYKYTNNSSFASPSNAYYMRFYVGETLGDYNISINYPSTITTYQPYQPQSVTLTFDNTIYSGVIDWCTGVVTVDKAMVDLGRLTWTYNTTYNVFYCATIPNGAIDNDDKICEIYWLYEGTLNNMPNGTFRTAGGVSGIYVKDTRYTDATTFTTAMDGVQLLNKLATPTTIQLTPTQLKTLAGYNTIYTDVGNITLEYWRKEVRE